ncbi:hypothetical protein MYX07_07090, partial [Patescibacteria group bacterium AH-259-L07]|nr:hypothetical protein [Patescibacteria group bacterium AH-259-L07]
GIVGIQAGRFVAQKGKTIEKWTGFGLLLFGAFALVAWIFDLRGFWFLQIPPPLRAWGVFLALGIIPAFVSYLKTKKKVRSEVHQPEAEMSKTAEQANLQCPFCGHTQKVDIPQNGCLVFHKCGQCQKIISVPKESKHCCVICVYSDKKCPAANQQTYEAK